MRGLPAGNSGWRCMRSTCQTAACGRLPDLPRFVPRRTTMCRHLTRLPRARHSERPAGSPRLPPQPADAGWGPGYARPGLRTSVERRPRRGHPNLRPSRPAAARPAGWDPGPRGLAAGLGRGSVSGIDARRFAAGLLSDPSRRSGRGTTPAASRRACREPVPPPCVQVPRRQRPCLEKWSLSPVVDVGEADILDFLAMPAAWPLTRARRPRRLP
jgi:hypothetical protein